MGFLDDTGVSRLVTKLKELFALANHNHSATDITSGTLSVSQGGTGKASHTTNSILVGNGTSAVKNISTKSGAFFATGANSTPGFGTLPVAQGGTGKGSHTTNSILAGNGNSTVYDISTAKGALYATLTDGPARFGILPVSCGGTGSTTASSSRYNLGIVNYNSIVNDRESTSYGTATKAYSIGDHFIHYDTLKKATASIAIGDTIDSENSIEDPLQDQIDNKLNISDYRRQITWGELEDSLTWGDLEGDTSSTGTRYTDDYHLAKPGLLNEASIIPINDNMDLLDDILADKLDDADYRKAMTWGEVGDKYNWGVLGSTSQTTGSTQTDILGLEKPGNNSTVDVDVLNDNYDIIDEAIEGTQSSMAMIESSTAQSNHTSGSYFMLDNVLHKATINIASGESIVSGSNATPITIEQALTALNSSIQSVQNSVTIVTGLLSFTSYVTNRYYDLIKIGNIVFLRVELIVTTANSGWRTIATLPSAFRPAIAGRIIWTYGDDNSIRVGSVDGSDLKISGNIEVSAIISAAIAYRSV